METKFIHLGENGKTFAEKLKNKSILLIALAAGIILLCIPKGGSSEKSTNTASQQPAFSLEEEEKKIGDALSRISGVGEVSVALTLKSGMEQQVARDETTEYKKQSDDYETQSSSSAVKIQNGSSNQSPLTLKYIYPEYKGALIIIQSSSSELKFEVTKAVAALTGLSTDKITVVSGR